MGRKPLSKNDKKERLTMFVVRSELTVWRKAAKAAGYRDVREFIHAILAPAARQELIG